MEVYLTLKKDTLKATEKEATEQAISDIGEEEGKNELVYSNLKFNISEYYFDEDKGTIFLSGELIDNGKELGYFSTDELPVDLDLVIDLVQLYMKKLGKLKTVLEATKG